MAATIDQFTSRVVGAQAVQLVELRVSRARAMA